MQQESSVIDSNSSEEKKLRYNILFLPKWYPNKHDPQLGVFIQKHAKAVSGYCNVCVLYICSDNSLQAKYQTEVHNTIGFPEIIIYYKSNTSVLKGLINPFLYMKAFRMGYSEIKKTLHKVDLIHVNVLNRPGIIALLIKKIKGIPFIVTEHWTGYVSGKYEQSGFLKRALTKLIAANSSAITTVSKGLKEKMIDLGIKGNYFVVPNVIESVPLPKPCANSEIKILTIADLADAHKNISEIIKVVAKVHKQNPLVEYHVIGDGPDLGMLRDLSDSLQATNNFIFFHGRKTNDFVYEFIKQVDFVVINSNYETFAVVAAEALACGKPVVTTKCGGPEDFITSEFGVLIEPDNPLQLENAIVTMMATFRAYDPQKLNDYITKKFNRQVIGKQLYDLYKSVITNYEIGLSGEKAFIDPSWRVLDVGSGHRPNRRANVLIDNELNETEHRSGQKATVPTDKKMVVGNALQMPFADKEFDFVIASHIAEHVDDPEQLCKELCRVGKRGYIETPGSFDEFFLNELFHKWIVSKKNNTLVFKEKNSFKPFSEFIYRLYYLNCERVGHKSLHSSNIILKFMSKILVKSWNKIPNSYTKYYWQDSIKVKVIRLKKQK